MVRVFLLGVILIFLLLVGCVETQPEETYLNETDSISIQKTEPNTEPNTEPDTETSSNNDTENNEAPADNEELAESDYYLDEMEKNIHDLINQEREKQSLTFLEWNYEVANVARLHSEYLANYNLSKENTEAEIMHEEYGEDSLGLYQDDRLKSQKVYYLGGSAENIAAYPEYESEKITYRNGVPIKTEKKWNTQTQIEENIVKGWMDSEGHRKNILNGIFNEAGIGIAEYNDYFIATQVFIERVECGYETGPCCEKEGYYPSCYVPLKCKEGICSS